MGIADSGPKQLGYGQRQFEATLFEQVFETTERYLQATTVSEKLARGEACREALRKLEEYLLTARIFQPPE